MFRLNPPQTLGFDPFFQPTRYLATLNRINDSAFIAEVTRRNREMIAGNFVTRDDILSADSKLRAEGR